MEKKDERIYMIQIPASELNELINSLKAEIKELKFSIDNIRKDAHMNKWVESEDARKQFGVSQRTWQSMRDNRQIPFTQFGRKIYVKQADIEAFMMSHYVEGKNKSKGIWNAIAKDR